MCMSQKSKQQMLVLGVKLGKERVDPAVDLIVSDLVRDAAKSLPIGERRKLKEGLDIAQGPESITPSSQNSS